MYSPVPTTVRDRNLGSADAVVLLIFLVFLHYFIALARQWTGSFQPEVTIDLSITALPAYSFFSLLRAFGAYLLSLGFTLVYGYLAAKSRASERILLPLLDIGQSIPVLGFMPGLVLGLIALFPGTNIGMELACILLVFTGQVWNMTFSFYASLRSVPTPYYEMSEVVGLSWLRKLWRIELPYAAIPLAWNSLMSMAGGWFFLIACESFTLGARTFRLPGLGSYMAVAIEKEDARAMLAGLIAMFLLILFSDFVVWRPVIAWTRRFRLEEQSDEILELPFMTLLLKESRLLRLVLALGDRVFAWGGKAAEIVRPDGSRVARQAIRGTEAALPVVRGVARRLWLRIGKRIKKTAGRALIGAVAILAAWALIRLWELVRGLTLSDWLTILRGTGATFLRVCGALLLGSLWTIPFGIWVGLSPKLTRIFQPLIQIGASFPAPMIYPLALGLFAWLGIGLGGSSTFLMLLGVQWYILFNVLAGATSISRELRDSFELTGVSRGFRWKTLFLPSVFPSLVTGWITAAGGAWNASIVAEYVQFRGETVHTLGLGALISQATAAGNYPLLTGSLVAMVISVVGLNRIVWRPIQRFAETRYRFER